MSIVNVVAPRTWRCAPPATKCTWVNVALPPWQEVLVILQCKLVTIRFVVPVWRVSSSRCEPLTASQFPYVELQLLGQFEHGLDSQHYSDAAVCQLSKSFRIVSSCVPMQPGHATASVDLLVGGPAVLFIRGVLLTTFIIAKSPDGRAVHYCSSSNSNQ